MPENEKLSFDEKKVTEDCSRCHFVKNTYWLMTETKQCDGTNTTDSYKNITLFALVSGDC